MNRSLSLSSSNNWHLLGLQKSNEFIQNVRKASFIAIDEEMSGIQVPTLEGSKLKKDDAPEDRYPVSTKQVSERYSIIQLGICLFEQVSGSSNFHVVRQRTGIDCRPRMDTIRALTTFFQRRYKFTLFPSPEVSITREVVLSPSSVKFLCEENNW